MRDKVLITGGSGGIGAATARACAARGAWPVIGYCADRLAAEAVVAQCRAGEILHLDLSCDNFSVLDSTPEISQLVHCAGRLSSERSLLAASEADLHSLFDVHLFGPLKVTQRLIAAGSPLKHVLFVLS